MNESKRQTVSLDELVSGRLPKRVIDAINSMELTIEEVLDWEASRPRMRAVVTDEEVVLHTTTRVPIKKLLKILGGVTGGVGSLWALIEWVLPLLTQ